MGLKLFCLCLAIFVAVEATLIPTSNNELRSKEDIQKIIEKIKNIIDTQIQKATAKLQEVLDKIKSVAEALKEKANAFLKNQIEEISDKLDDLEKYAAKLGVQASVCIDLNKQELEDLKSKIIPQVTDCLSIASIEGKKLIETFKDAAKVVYGKVEALEKEFLECTDPACYGKMFIRASKLLLEIPLEITKLVGKTVKTLVKVQIDLPKCLTKQTVQFVKDSQTIFKNIKTCIDDKANTRALEVRGKEEIIKIIEKIYNIIKEKAEQLVKLFDQFRTVIEKILDGVKTIINELVADALKKIDELISEAGALQIDVTECVGDRKTQIQEIAVLTFSQVSNCVQQQLTDVSQIKEVIKEDLKQVYAKIEELEKTFLECDTLTCYIKLGFEANKLLLATPVRIAKMVAKSTKIIATAQINAGKCVATTAEEFTQATAPIVEYVLNCISEKINGSNNDNIYFLN